MSNVRLTSVVSYYDLKDKGLLTKRCEEVYEWLKDNPDSSDHDIRRGLGYDDPNKVRPRRKDLFDMGLIYESGKKVDLDTYKSNITWSVNDVTNWTTFQDFKNKQSRVNQDKRPRSVCYNPGYVDPKEKLEGSVPVRYIVSKNLNETTIKIVQHFDKFPHDDFKTILVYHRYDVDSGVYKAKLIRNLR